MSIQSSTNDVSVPQALRRAFSAFPTGVVGIGVLVDGEPLGMAVNSFTSISLEPPLVAVSVARTSSTWPVLAAAPRLGLSILGNGHQGLCRQLSSRRPDRFAGAEWHATEGGAVLIEQAALWLECGIHAVFDGGDHEIVLLKVLESNFFPEVEPLVFHQSEFRGLQIQ